jgi:hypothetical protein
MSALETTWTSEQDRWKAERAYLREHQEELSRRASDLYPHLPRFEGLPLLSRQEWIPHRPVPFQRVRPILVPLAPPPLVVGGEPESSGVRPLMSSGRRYSSYSAAIGRLDRPRLFENRPTYNLSQASLLGDVSMEFTMGNYFDCSDVSTAVAHELASAVSAGRFTGLDSLPFRRLVADPTDSRRRPIPVAIVTLTLRHDVRRGDVRFLSHWRAPGKVAAFGGMHSVVPVGMFQPSGSAATDGIGDFDLWRSVAREYSEELLGAEEHVDVDYADWPFFDALEKARSEGTCRPYCVGIVVDPLTFATDILAVTVFESETFNSLFAGLVEENDEGSVAVRSADGTFGTRFDEEHVHRMVTEERMQPAGAAVLRAAWRMRGALLGT